jgi:hypothetical protein
VKRLLPLFHLLVLLGDVRQANRPEAVKLGHDAAVPLNLTSRGRADPAGVVWACAPTESAIVTAIAIIIVKPTASLFRRYEVHIHRHFR